MRLKKEKEIRDFYKNQAETARLRSKTDWFEQGEKSTLYFFNLEKRNGQNKLWQRIKGSNGQFKYDIDSILDEQIKFDSKLFTSEGWDKNSGDDLLSFVQQKLTDVEKNELEEDLII
jgi:hypothetical protein